MTSDSWGDAQRKDIDQMTKRYCDLKAKLKEGAKSPIAGSPVTTKRRSNSLGSSAELQITRSFSDSVQPEPQSLPRTLSPPPLGRAWSDSVSPASDVQPRRKAFAKPSGRARGQNYSQLQKAPPIPTKAPRMHNQLPSSAAMSQAKAVFQTAASRTQPKAVPQRAAPGSPRAAVSPPKATRQPLVHTKLQTFQSRPAATLVQQRQQRQQRQPPPSNRAYHQAVSAPKQAMSKPYKAANRGRSRGRGRGCPPAASKPTVKFCTNCGTSAVAKFCLNCGHPT